MDLKVLNIDTPSLGDCSYLVHDGTTALIVDPQRDIDRIDDLLRKESLVLGAVVETHMHNDYLSGGLELTRKHGVPYVVSKEDEVTFTHLSVVHNQVLNVGTFAIRAMKTPGHTFTHLSYLLLSPETKSVGLFTGGSLLHGSTGRPDLLGWENTFELAGLQYRSARYLADELEDDVDIYPTHGFGSFCSSTPSLTDASTIGDEKRTNPVLIQDQATYVSTTLEALDRYPTYFAKMGPANHHGAPATDLSPLTSASKERIESAIKSGAWVVDLRDRTLWSAQHILGSTSLGIDGSFASYLGWLYPYESELFLISDNESDIAKAQRELVRIGIERPTGSFVGELTGFHTPDPIKIVHFSDIPAAREILDLVVLDVRQEKEREKSYLEASIFIPFYDVEARVDELPTSSEIWVHCASGYRAALVLKCIEASGRIPVLINDDYKNAAAVLGLGIITSEKK